MVKLEVVKLPPKQRILNKTSKHPEHHQRRLFLFLFDSEIYIEFKLYVQNNGQNLPVMPERRQVANTPLALERS